jgi:hypothetical protein
LPIAAPLAAVPENVGFIDEFDAELAFNQIQDEEIPREVDDSETIHQQNL